MILQEYTTISKIILLFYFYLFINSTKLLSENIEVCGQCKISSIQTAIQNALPNSQITIMPGEYKESSIVIDKPIQILGKDLPTIDGEKKGHVFHIKSDNVQISNLRIIHSGVSDTIEYAGIYADQISNCTISNNKLEDNAYGIYLAKSKNCLIEKNSTIGNAKDEVFGGNGIHLWYSELTTIQNNFVQHHRDGLYLEFSSNLTIIQNESSYSIRYGMHFMFTKNNKFFKNKFYQNPTGVAVMYSSNVIVEDNLFTSSKGIDSYGFLLKDIKESEFKRNIFKENTIGIQMDGSGKNLFQDNLITDNGWGISILGNSDNNSLKNNDFINNVFDLNTNTLDSTNIYKGNHWSKYKGYDLNRDSIGDQPHRPIQFFGYWVAKYPFLMVLFESPIMGFLELAEKAFPIITPIELIDELPKLKRTTNL